MQEVEHETQEKRDFVKETRDYLKKYGQIKVTIENLKDDIEMWQEEMDSDIAAPITKYDIQPGGGASTMTTVEAAVARHDKLMAMIQHNERQIKNLERIIRKIDRAIDGLDTEDQNLIRGHFIEHRRWRELSAEKFFTEKWARERSRKALKVIAFMLFGEYSLIA